MKVLGEQDVANRLADLAVRASTLADPHGLWVEILETLQEYLEASGLELVRVDGTRVAAIGRPDSSRSVRDVTRGSIQPGNSALPLSAGGALRGALLVSGVPATRLQALSNPLAPLLAFTAIWLERTLGPESDGATRVPPGWTGWPLQAGTFQALYELAIVSQGVLEPESIAQFAVDHVRDLLKVDHSSLYWFDEEAGGLRPLADNDPQSPNVDRVLQVGQGASGIAFSTREPCVIDDYPGWEGATLEGIQRGIQSTASVPLIIGDRAAGALAARTYTPHHFTQQDIALLTLFAAGVAPAVEVARLYEESEHRREIAMALADLVRTAAADPEPERVVGLVTRESVSLLGGDYAAIALFEDGLDSQAALTWHGVWGNESNAWTAGRPATRGGLADRSVTAGKTLVARQVGDSPDFPWEVMPTHRAERGRTVLSTPLVTRRGVIGALVVGWRRDVTLSSRQTALAEALAGYAASMIDNAEAHADALARTEELDASLRELSASQRRLETLYEAVSCGILVRDMNGAIIHANAAAQQIFGVPVQDMIGKRAGETSWKPAREDGTLLAPDEHPSAIAARTWRPVRTTLAALRPDGERRWLQVDSVAIVNAHGAVESIVSSFIDISARVEAEAALKDLNEKLEDLVAERTADLAAAYRELEGFSYSVSHDLRAPLRGIDGLSQVVLEEYADQLDEVGQQYLRRVRAASQRMGRLIDAILGLFRVTRTELRREAVDLSALAQTLATELTQSEPERDVEIVIEPDVRASGDPDLLRLVLQNLLGNAWKFTSKHQRARIEFGSLSSSGEQVYFVRDDGAGFDMEYADKLFRPFERLHETREFEGDGVGLANVERVILRHGGRIWAEGATERGATFYFTLAGASNAGRRSRPAKQHDPSR